MRKLTVIIVIMLLFSACAGNTGPSAAETDTGALTISFDYAKQSGHASNQFAVWIEDDAGNFIKTLYVTRFTANGGYKNRPESIPTWVEKSGLDGVSGATPKPGALSYSWDLTNAEGNTVAPGAYRFLVEGSLRWQNRVLYSGVIEIGGEPATAQAEAQFFYEAAGDTPALTENSEENSMIGPVTANYTPPL